MFNLKANEPENENLNNRLFQIGTQIKDGSLYNALENLRKNS